MPVPRLPSDRVIAALRRALRQCSEVWLEDVTRDLLAGRDLDAALSNTPRLDGYLRRALESGWLQAWEYTSRELRALVTRNPRRWRRYDRARYEQFAPPPPSPPPSPPPAAAEEWPADRRFRRPQPVPLPREWREYDPAESRTTAEWLADHEASVSRFIPYEYRDEYLIRRLPPLVGVAEDGLRRAARDAVGAVAERGFGVREGVQALRQVFPSFSDWRLENIARTDGAVLYEHGRAARYLADPVVIGIRLNGIADSRQSEICAWHDGRCYRLGDPAAVFPPLHYQCRTTQEPVLFDEDPDWTTEQAPEDAAPLEGFGAPDWGALPDNAEQTQLPF